MRGARAARVAAVLLLVVSVHAGAEEVELPSDLPLMAEGGVTFLQFYRHLASRNPGADEYYAREVYSAYAVACAIEGVSLTVALSQMLHETDCLLFSGSVDATQYNFAGMGATGPGVPGLTFETLDIGVRAHVQHLKAYGTTEALVLDLVDPRFAYVRRGSAPTVMELAGRWATDPDYGPKVLAHAHRMLVKSVAP